MPLASDAKAAASRIGYGWRKGKAWSKRDGDTAVLLSRVGDRMAWRAEAIAAMQLLTNLATPQATASVEMPCGRLDNVIADVRMLVADLTSLKGVVSDHEIVIETLKHFVNAYLYICLYLCIY